MGMKILVINVALRPELADKHFPTGLGYIVTAMKNAGFDFDLLDIDAHRFSYQELGKLINKKNYDVVCMGCMVTGYKIIKQLSALVREHHPFAKIIVGNSVATSVVKTLLTSTEADIAVMGEGDETIVDLLCAINESRPLETVRGICFIKDGRLIQNPPRPYIKNISSMPLLDFSLFNVEIYIEYSKYLVSEPTPIPRGEIRALPVNTARGCNEKCTFCYHNFNGIPYRYRTAESIVTELRSLIEKYSVNYIRFVDDLAFYSKRQTLHLVQKFLDSGLHFYWIAACRADLFTDDDDMEIIYKMKKAGCAGMAYSLESADPDILKAMHKNITAEQFSKQTKLFHKAGIPTWTAVVLGYPQESPATLKKTFDCCIENKIYPSTGYLLPQPGSPMYDYAVENNFIKDEEDYLLRLGDRQDLRLNMTKMTDEEFQLLVTEGLKRCNEKLRLGLKFEELIKTKYHRASKNENIYENISNCRFDK